MFEELKKRKPTLIDMELYHPSAVVIPLIEKDGEYHVLFEVRSNGLKRQPGKSVFREAAVKKVNHRNRVRAEKYARNF